jgi:hypothetical protein
MEGGLTKSAGITGKSTTVGRLNQWIAYFVKNI